MSKRKRPSKGAEEEPPVLAPPAANLGDFDNDIQPALITRTPFKNPAYAAHHGHKRNRNFKQIVSAIRAHKWPSDAPTYVSIAAPPSLFPAKKYCDITGLEAKYTHPRTGLRYHSATEYQIISGLTQEAVTQYLSLRGVNPPSA